MIKVMQTCICKKQHKNRNFQSNSRSGMVFVQISCESKNSLLSKIKCIFILFVCSFLLYLLYCTYIIHTYSPCFFLFCYFLPDCLTACLLHACRLWIWLIMWIFVLLYVVWSRAMHEEWLKIITKLSFRIVDSYNDFIYISVLYCLMG